MNFFAQLGWATADDMAAGQMSAVWPRPLLGLSYAFNRWLNGYWVATNLLLHLFAVLFVFLIMKTVTTRGRALCAAALFSVCPLTADAVWSVAGRSSLMCSMFMLGAVWLFTRRNLAWTLFAAGAFATKEEAAALPIILIALSNMKTRLKVLLSTLYVIAAACFGARTLFDVDVYAHVGFLRHVATFLTSLGRFMLLNQSGDPLVDVEPFHIFLVFVAVVGLIAMYQRGSSELCTLSFCSGVPALPIILLLFSPLAIYLFAPLPDPFFEHRAYFAVAAAAMFIASTVPMNWSKALFGIFVVLMANRLVVYSSPERLYTEAVEKAPLKLRPQVNLAGALLQQERRYEALDHMERAYAIEPKNNQVVDNLVFTYLHMGKYDEASRVVNIRAYGHGYYPGHYMSKEVW